MAQVKLKVENMSCDHCVRTVTDTLSGVPGVERVVVSLADGQAAVEYDPARASLEHMREKLAEEDYPVSATEPLAD